MAANPTMEIGGDLDPKRVLAVSDATVDAMNALYDKLGGDKLAPELLEGILCAACDVIKGAPSDDQRFDLADRAFMFIMRNCGLDPMDFMARRLQQRALANSQPAGTA